MRGEMALEPYITHTFEGLEGVNPAIAALHSGSCLRAVVHIGKNELPPLRLPTLKANVKMEGGWMKQVRFDFQRKFYLVMVLTRTAAINGLLIFLSVIHQCTDLLSHINFNVTKLSF